MSLIANALARLADIFDFIPMSNRNWIIDGAMERFVGLSASAGAATVTKSCAAFFTSYSGNGGACTQSQVAASVLQGIDNPSYATPLVGAITHQQTTGSTGTIAAGTSAAVWTAIEDVRTLSGRSATFSMWLWVDSGSITITNLVARQNFGTGGSPSAQINTDTLIPNGGWVVTTTPKRFSVRVDLPSVAGKTFGTNGDSWVQLGIWLPPGATYNVSTTQWQFEQSSPYAPSSGLPTAFEYRGRAAEYDRAARYWQSGVQATARAWATAASQTFNSTVNWPQMRASPTLTILTAPTSANATVSGILGATSQGGRYEIVSVAAGDCYAANAFYNLDARLN